MVAGMLPDRVAGLAEYKGFIPLASMMVHGADGCETDPNSILPLT
jgi:hypothetical protein